MGSTTNYGFTYPGSSDAADGPAQMAELAQDIDTQIKAIEDKFLVGRSTADQTVNASTTLVNATSMSVAVAASSNYLIDGWLMYASDTTPDIKFAFTYPAAATLSWSGSGYWTNIASGGPAGATGGEVNLNARNRSATAISAGGIGAGTAAGMVIRGLLIVGGTAGTLQLQFAQEVSNASDTKLLRDSWISARKV